MSATFPRSIDPRLLDQLPTVPGTAVEFLRLCDDPTSGVKDVAQVAQRDPALLARLLQVANSPFYSPREPVTDAVRASAILGLSSLKMIGIGFAIVGDLWTSTAKSEQLSGIIGASAMAGSGARSFSARIGTGRDEEALTSGLLSYVGELALLRRFPEEFAEAWLVEGGLPSLEHQRETMGVDGARVGEALLESWHIPEDLRDGVRARSQPLADRLRRTPNVFDAAVGFGTAISDLLAARSESALEAIRPFARDWGLSHDDLMAYWAEFRTAARHTDQQLGVEVGAELDAAITAARDDYLASPVHAQGQLHSAQREIDELRAENERLEGLSLRDPLTGIPNRPAFENHLRTSLAALKRYETERPVAVALFDLDHFKQVNDGLGHFVGDELLRAIATAGDETVRTEGLFARLGGDEFAMVLRPASMDDLEAAVDRVRKVMVAAAVETVADSATTVSAGAAFLDRLDVDIVTAGDALGRAADDALYAAKRRGRDQTFVTPAMATGLAAGALEG